MDRISTSEFLEEGILSNMEAHTCRSATPTKVPATTMRLSWSHFSNWPAHPLVWMKLCCSSSCKKGREEHLKNSKSSTKCSNHFPPPQPKFRKSSRIFCSLIRGFPLNLWPNACALLQSVAFSRADPFQNLCPCQTIPLCLCWPCLFSGQTATWLFPLNVPTTPTWPSPV